MLDIYVQSQIGLCSEFMDEDEKHIEKEVSIVISPVRIIGIEEKGSALKIISGCNMWQACYNHKCYFSKAARVLPKVKGVKI